MGEVPQVDKAPTRLETTNVSPPTFSVTFLIINIYIVTIAKRLNVEL